MKKSDAYQSYLFIESASSLLFRAAFTAKSLYEIRVAGLSPLQLVLVGTTLELSVLVCEVPTGVVADVYSRRLLQTIRLGLRTIRQRPRLIKLLGVGLFYGLYSEGFDRWWVKHLPHGFHRAPPFEHALDGLYAEKDRLGNVPCGGGSPWA